MRPWSLTLLLSLGLACQRGVAVARSDSQSAATPRRGDTAAHADSQFAAVQRRGATVMGVDQYTAKHVFEDLPNGGRIVLERDDASDTAAVRTIRTHMREIEAAFHQGNFSAPGLVHAQTVPGTDVMRSRRGFIAYVVTDRPRGAELRILTSDGGDLGGSRVFAFQRLDHRAGGHEAH